MREPTEEDMVQCWKADETLPEANAEMAGRIWAGLRPQLRPYRRPTAPWTISAWPQATWAAAALLLVCLGFLAGRAWEHKQTFERLAAQHAAERVLLVAASEHLERAERFLVELQGSAGASPELVPMARDLLGDNKLFHQSAVFARDKSMAEVLDRLGRVLAEVADGSPDSLHRLQRQWRLEELLRSLRTEQLRAPLKI